MSVMTDITAEDIALSLLRECFADADNKISFPVDPTEVASYLGIDMFVANHAYNVLGVIAREGDKTRITLSGKADLKTKRVLAAELIGSFFLHERGEDFGHVIREQARATETRKYMRRFAMTFLLPGSAVRKLWGEGHSIRKMARIFGVRMDIMEMRLIDLNLI